MAASTSDIARLRRMIGEPSETTYLYPDLAEALERWPLPDAVGLEPDVAAWAATYDVHAAAAEILADKASVAACEYDSADGGGMKQYRSQKFTHYMKLSRHHSARRHALSVQPAVAHGPTLIDAWIGNLAEVTDDYISV